MARTAWLIGFCSATGFYQVKSKEIQGLYMDSAHTEILAFNGNHKAISAGGTGNTQINLDAIRRRFDLLCDYAGAGIQQKIAACIGFFVVLLMESKSKEICERHCSAISGSTYFTLGDDWVNQVITNWSSISQEVMLFVDDINYQPHNCGIDYFKQSDELLDTFYYLHIDAYFSGLFKHDSMEPEPRVLVWDPIDSGLGDGDIVVPGEPVPKDSGSIRCSVRRKQNKNPRRSGLSGGGLGGPPEAPQVFRTWAESGTDDKHKCDMLVAHLRSMKLNVLQAKRKVGSMKLEDSGKRSKGAEDFCRNNGEISNHSKQF